MNTNNSLIRLAQAAAAVGGLLIALGGVGVSLLMGLGIFLSPTEVGIDSPVVGVAFLTLGLGLGMLLVWHAGRAFWGYASMPFSLPPVWIFGLIFIPTLIIGQLLISFEVWPFLTFPPVHVVAAIVPSLAILAFAGRVLKSAQTRWREIVVQLAGGAFLSTTVAFILEIIIGIIVLIVVFIIAALLPGGATSLEEMATNIQDPTWLENPENLANLLLSPPVAASIVLVFVVLAPFLEEMTKLLGIMLMNYRRPSLARIFMWGLASGAGFGLVENLLNTVTGLDIWALVMIMRVGATLMHCLGSGLMALGWRYAVIERRPQRFLGLYGLSVILHAAWNGAVIGMAGTALISTDSSVEMFGMVGSWVVVLFVALLALLFIAMLVALVMITYRLRDHLTPPEAVEPAVQFVSPTV